MKFAGSLFSILLFSSFAHAGDASPKVEFVAHNAQIYSIVPKGNLIEVSFKTANATAPQKAVLCNAQRAGTADVQNALITLEAALSGAGVDTRVEIRAVKDGATNFCIKGASILIL